MQKEVLSLHKLEGHAYELQNPFGLKEDKPSQKNCQNQFSHPSVSHIEQECQESLIQGKSTSSEIFEQRPQISVKLSFIDLCDSKFCGLYAFDTTILVSQKRVKDWKSRLSL